MTHPDAYRRAQLALAELKAAVLEVLVTSGPDGLSNADVGKRLGIYHGYPNAAGDEEHNGHISRVILSELQRDRLVEQDRTTRRWKCTS